MNYDYRNKVELLSPVGSRESLYAAVQQGCDAVYFGGKDFNARRRADNFSLEELKEVFEYLHIRGVKAYITVNTLYKDSEIREVLSFVEQVYRYGVDGVIVQDLGLAQLIRRSFPDLDLHGSTQMTVHNLEGANYLESLGFSRVVLARELSLEEVRKIKEGTDLEIEAFVHGALCISYSGQCLMSSLIGGRSGNRGLCAQPCRLPYSLVDLDSNELIGEEFDKKYLLSPKDINTLEIIPGLIEAGVSSLKIEGRMKRPEYTALVTQKYRKYLDSYLSSGKEGYKVELEDQEAVTQVFNREGFIPGYYLGKEGLDLISYDRPKNWGVKVGEVINYDRRNNLAKVRLDKKLEEGDGVEVWTDGSRNPGLFLSDFEYKGNNVIQFEIKGKIKKGNPLYRTSQQSLLKSVEESYGGKDVLKQIRIYGDLKAKVGEPMTLKLWDKDGHFTSVEGEFILEEAKNRPIGSEDLKEQISKLGNTPYNLVELNIDMDNNLFVPISKINGLRRRAVENLDIKRSKQFMDNYRNNQVEEGELELESRSYQKDNKISVYIKDIKLVDSILSVGVDRIYLDLEKVKRLDLDNLAKRFKKKGTQLMIKLPQIARQAEMDEVRENLKRLEKSQIDGYLVGQLGQAYLLRDSNKILIGDYPLNTFNSYSVKHWLEEGYRSITLSPELNLEEIREINSNNPIQKELIVYGHLPMMISEYCPIGGVKRGFDLSKECKSECRKANYGLLDRKGMIAPVIGDPKSCSSIIYNSQPIYLMKYLQEIGKSGSSSYRLDFIFEGERDVVEIIKGYKERLLGIPSEGVEIDALSFKMRKKGYTTGHFYRGVE
ncbi:DUF3656 domain-containing U32 family peptidase [Halonatronum saccharophilum]|uniref:DUF3656 domain-containing U32 family peptidase n=1 Tax=Halonatronum saccharophilum TaxID=150060 RepID=UPI0004814F20|nr:U32 family peptidase [Halonatronum saccharophilum]